MVDGERRGDLHGINMCKYLRFISQSYIQYLRYEIYPFILRESLPLKIDEIIPVVP